MSLIDKFAVVVKDGQTISPIFRVIPDPEKLDLKKGKRIDKKIQLVDDKNMIKLKNKLLNKFINPGWKAVYVAGLGKKIDLRNNHWDDSKQQIINSPYPFTSEDLDKIKQAELTKRIKEKNEEWIAEAIIKGLNPETFKLTKAQGVLAVINEGIDDIKWDYCRII